MDLNFAFDYQILNLGLALLGFIVVNVLLGSMDGFLKREFDKEKFISGLIKGFIVSLSFVLVYLIGAIIPEISIEINGNEVTILMAINLILVGGIIYYGKQVLEKLISFVGAKF